MISGAHIVIYSTDHEADRNLLRDVLKLPNVDVGHGWLIFGLPPSECAVHPAESNGKHELWFLSDDLDATIAGLKAHGVSCTEPETQMWGKTTEMTLPGGGKIGLYQPRHARPPSA